MISFTRHLLPKASLCDWRAYIDNVIQANEKALFTPEDVILKGQKEYRNIADIPMYRDYRSEKEIPHLRDNLELEEHKYLLR